jgi:hypothetical protein
MDFKALYVCSDKNYKLRLYEAAMFQNNKRVGLQRVAKTTERNEEDSQRKI